MNSGGTSGPVERAERAADEKESLCCRKLHPNNIMWSLRSVPQRKAAAALCFVGWRFWSGCRNGRCFDYLRGTQDRVAECCYLFRLMREEYYLTSLQESALCRRDMAGGVSERARAKKARDLHFAETTAYHLSVWYRVQSLLWTVWGKIPAGPQGAHASLSALRKFDLSENSPGHFGGGDPWRQAADGPVSRGSLQGYALIAGFTEMGRSAEDTVRREVMEEVGLRSWTFVTMAASPGAWDSNLLMGFYAVWMGRWRFHGPAGTVLSRMVPAGMRISLRPDGYSLPIT